MTNSRFYSSNAAVTSLQVTAAPSDASIQVASSSGWPGTFPFTLSLDYGSANEELVDVTGGGPSIFNVTRAVDGTSATTHNAGAVVRHVSSARDFTDSRTHEASNTGVHGISGSFVDTASTQTLSNKTLNAPTINNATLTGTATATGATISGATLTSTTLTSPTVNSATWSGTVAGNATVSGAISFTGNNTTFSGGPNFTTLSALFTRTNATDPTIRARLTADTQSRLLVQADGSLVFGSGSATGDTTLSRTTTSTLGVTGNLSVSGSLSAPTISGNPSFTGTPTFTPTTISGASLISDLFTNGWGLTDAEGRSAGGVTTIRLQVTRIGSSISSDSSGNITDTTVGTLAAGWRPLDGTHITTYDKGGTASGSASITTAGTIILKSLMANNTIGAADSVTLSLTFVSAT